MSRRHRSSLIAWGLILACTSIAGAAPPLSTSSTRPSGVSGRAALEMAADLASDVAPADAPRRANVLDALWHEVQISDIERDVADHLFDAPPDAAYTAITPAASTRPVDLLAAARRSQSRLFAAQDARDRTWMAKQAAASRKYAGLAADGLEAEAAEDESAATKLSARPYANRRAPDQQAAYRDRLRSEGLSPQHRALLKEGGKTDADIAASQKQLADRPPKQLGISIVELLRQIATGRHELADQLRQYADSVPSPGGRSTAKFLVANPHDRAETVHLFIRRISIPEQWLLSVEDLPPATPGERAAFPVQEASAGREYTIHLPARAQTHVNAVLTPVGSVGADTTARWAVEGRIDQEIIGGMVHEMIVPAMVDVELPPVGPVGVATTAGPSSIGGTAPAAAPAQQTPRGHLLPISVAAGAALLAVAVALVIIPIRRRRRRGPHEPPATPARDRTRAGTE